VGSKRPLTKVFVLEVQLSGQIVFGGFGRAIGKHTCREACTFRDTAGGGTDRNELGIWCAGFEKRIGCLKKHQCADDIHLFIQ
jgi:hypothetical protein